ncbi:MAG: hypothetical protein Q9159_003520 [Coniocarpon cinnabarinum]
MPNRKIELLQEAHTSHIARSSLLWEVVGLLRENEITLSSADYRMLLQYGLYVQDTRFIEIVWDDLLAAGIVPDLTCLNLLMESALPEKGLRQDSASYERAQANGEPHTSDCVARVRQILDRMTNTYAISPDTNTYTHLMMAYACDGRLDQALDVLRSVWGFDANSVEAGHATTHVSSVQEGHPLYPNTRLLCIIAEILGHSGRVLSAFRLVDYISHHYNIPIRQRVSTTILYWTSIHSYREGKAWKQNHIGVPTAFARTSQLFSMLQSQGIGSLDEDTLTLIFSSLRGQRMTARDEVLRLIAAEASLYAAHSQMKRQRARLFETTRDHRLGRVRSAKKVGRLRSLFAKADLEQRMIGVNLRNMLSNAIQQGVPASVEQDEDEEAQLEDWRLRGIPRLIQKYDGFVPPQLRYQVPSGEICLTVRNRVDTRWRKRSGLTQSMPYADRKGRLLPRMQHVLMPTA